MNELRNCPFCGEIACEESESEVSITIRCSVCTAVMTGKKNSRKRTIKKWNRRADRNDVNSIPENDSRNEAALLPCPCCSGRMLNKYLFRGNYYIECDCNLRLSQFDCIPVERWNRCIRVADR